MFEEDLTVLSTPDLLESAAAHRAEVNRLDARLIEHAQVYADRYHPDVCPARLGRRPGDGRERAIVLGGEGCPEVAEFAPAEFGAMLGISAEAAADFIGQALALRHRLPLTWARVLAGEATPWKAGKIATACLDLPEEAARAVDRRVARLVDSLTAVRLDKIVEAAKKHADPDGARKKAEEKARERGVYLGRSDEHGTRKIFIRAPSGHANRFNAKIGSIAEALKIFGDTRTVQHRRAEAVGIIADSRYTEELLHQAHNHLRNTPPEPPPTAGSGGQPADAAAGQGATAHGPTTKDRRANPATDAPTGRDVAPTAATATDDGVERPAARHDATTPKADTPTGQGAAPPADSVTGRGVAPSVGAAADQGAASTADSMQRRGAASPADPVTGRDVAPSVGAATDQGAASTVDRGGAPPGGRVADHGTLSTAGPAASTRASTAPATVREASTAGPERGPDRGAERGECGECGECAQDGEDCRAWSGEEYPPGDWAEPGLDDEADRDAPYPGDSDLPDPLDAPFQEVVEPFDPGLRVDLDDGEPLDAGARRALDARLAQIRHDAHTNPRTGRPPRPGQTEIYVHLTDHTLATGTGVLRVEDLGPLLASQLRELVGHGPYTVKPVIDLHAAVSVDAYEIPDRIRERVKLIHPVELFPYGSRETHARMDLDHIEPYDPLGPPGQTTPANLAPLRRFPHRVKTHGRWQLRRLDPKTLEWTTPNGFTFHVDPTGTHRAPEPNPD